MAFFLLALSGAAALERREVVRTATNPIRKVVAMLQSMQQKVSEEGEREKELYEKFMCYCKTSGGDLGSSISAAETKIPALGKDIEAATASKVQAEEDLKQAQVDRDAAVASMTEATAIREKEAAAFAKSKADSDANIAAITRAVAALERGMSGSFLQSHAARVVLKFVSESQGMDDGDRQALISFLSASHSSEYWPQSGQIAGILKQLGDELSKGLADDTGAENAAISTYKELMAAKTKEKAALTEAIETKMARIGESGVSIAEMKNDMTDTEEALLADQTFIADLEKNCKTKTAEWEERSKTRAEELVALAETIKVLNDDDALELFKKALPSVSASFAQVRASSTALRTRALAKLKQALQRSSSPDRVQLDLVALALHGKKVGFEKVIVMIDDMIAILKKEQQDDVHKKEYCGAQFDQSDDAKKALERKVSDEEAAIATAEEAVTTLTAEIAALQGGIKALDNSVAEATEARKAEHEQFMNLMASNSAAKEVLEFAKNRLHQFYNPKLYKAPAKREFSAQDRITVNMGGTEPPRPPPGGIAGTGIAVLAQVGAHMQHRDSPRPPPQTFGAYTKSPENAGVIEMLNLLIKDLDKDMTQAQTEEKESQADYEAMMQDSAQKRTTDSKSLSEKEGAKADTDTALQAHKDGKVAVGNELMATMAYIKQLHAECDWLIQYFDMRKDARAGEIDALANAKAVLSGADLSFLQARNSGSFRRV